MQYRDEHPLNLLYRELGVQAGKFHASACPYSPGMALDSAAHAEDIFPKDLNSKKLRQYHMSTWLYASSS